MKTPSLKKQILGDINEQLNEARRKMNEDIRQKCFEMAKKKNNT